MRPFLLVAMLGGLPACGSNDTEEPPRPEPADACDPVAELTLPDGSCLRPGVPLDACAEGFEHDGAYGCVPVLPREPCGPGQMALPGETSCRPVAPCPAEPWGNIPPEAGTQYVDAAFIGVSDGTITSPWSSITEAVAAAAPGGLVAVEAGIYQEPIGLTGKPVRIVGVCPSEVTITASTSAIPGCPAAVICSLGGSAGSEVRGVTITGEATGVIASDTSLALREVIIAGCPTGGVVAESTLGPAALSVEGSLFEGNGDAAIRSRGADFSIADSVVRDTVVGVGIEGGRGVTVTQACDVVGQEVICGDPFRPQLAVSRSVVLRNQGLGISVVGGDAVVTDSVIRDTVASPTGGAGVSAAAVCATTPLGSICTADSVTTLQLVGSLVEGNGEIGLYVLGSAAEVDRSTIRATQPRADDATNGINVVVQPPCARVSGLIECNDAHPGALVAARSVVEDGFVNGVANFDSSVELREVVVARHQARLDNGLIGDGVASLGDLSQMTIARSFVDDSDRVGLSSFGTTISLTESAVRCTPIPLATDDLRGLSGTIQDAGGNRCGCPEATEDCKVISATLEPPTPLE